MTGPAMTAVTVYRRTIRLNRAARAALGDPTVVGLREREDPDPGCPASRRTVQVEVHAAPLHPRGAFAVSRGGSIRWPLGALDRLPLGAHPATVADGVLIVPNPSRDGETAT